MHSLLPLRHVDFVLFNKQWLPYTLGRKGETFLWVFQVLNRHIAFAIGAKFHCLTFKVEANNIIIY